MIRALLWKEFREHALRFAILCTLALLFAACSLYDRDRYETVREITDFAIGLVWFVPVWIAASTVVSEKTRNTDLTLAALPIAPWKIWTIKTAVALATICLPILLAGSALPFAQSPDHAPFTPYQLRALLLGLATIYLLTTALTIRAKRETTVAICGVLLVLALFLQFACVESWFASRQYEWSHWYLLAPSPFAFLRHYDGIDESPLPIQSLFAIGWWLLGLHRYLQPAPSPQAVPPPLPATKPHRPLRPARSILAALAWRECREQGIIILGAALAGTLIASIFALSEIYARPYSTEKLLLASSAFSEAMFGVAMVAPAIVAALLGIGSWASDLHSQVHEFWRSRPISTGALFWIKFLLSLLGIATLLAAFTSISFLLELWKNQAREDPRQFLELLHNQSAILPAVLALSILVAILIRRTMYAGIVIILLLIAAAITIDRLDEPPLAALTAAALATLTLARLALARNWQLKSANP